MAGPADENKALERAVILLSTKFLKEKYSHTSFLWVKGVYCISCTPVTHFLLLVGYNLLGDFKKVHSLCNLQPWLDMQQGGVVVGV